MKFLRTFAVAFAALTFQVSAADEPKTAAPERDYVRFVGDDKRGKLETSIVTMKNDAGVEVELVGAIHVADTAYYKALNQLFTRYDALLTPTLALPPVPVGALRPHIQELALEAVGKRTPLRLLLSIPSPKPSERMSTPFGAGEKRGGHFWPPRRIERALLGEL